MKLYNKIKWILGVLMVFIIILTTNLVDRNNFKRVKDSVVTIYEDRLIAGNLIFEMQKATQNIERNLNLRDTTLLKQTNENAIKVINDLIARFELTRLTAEEEVIFKTLKTNFEKLKNLKISQNNINNQEYKALEQQLELINNNLNALFKVQVNEGRREMSKSKHALNRVELFTQIEIYFLIFLAVAIQIIIMYNPKP